MAEKTEKSWWERNVEDTAWADYDRQRALIPEGDFLARAQHDIKVGAAKGTYGFAKGLVVGLVDIAKVSYKLYTHDKETEEKTWQVIKKVAIESWIYTLGTPEQKTDQNKRMNEASLAIGNAIYKKMKADWDAASGTEGKRTELLSQWGTRGVLEVAALFIGAGEVQEAANAAKAAKLLEEGAVLEKYLAECEAARALEEMQTLEAVRAAEAARAANAVDAAKAAPAAEAAKTVETAKAAALTPDPVLAERAGPLKEPWLIRPGEGKLPATARQAAPGSPMVLDPKVSDTYMYVVKEDGTITYAPQKIENGMETVKHTDLAENGPARVSGEIKYDPATDQWVMNSESGRYSAEPIVPGDPNSMIVGNRSAENLDAAAELARQSGTSAKIVVKPE